MSINMIIVYAYKQHLFYRILVQVLIHRIVLSKYGNRKPKAIRILSYSCTERNYDNSLILSHEEQKKQTNKNYKSKV